MIVPGFDFKNCWFDHGVIGMLEVAYQGHLQASSATANSMNSNRFAYYYVISQNLSALDLSFGFCRPFQRFLFINFHLRQGSHMKLVTQRTSLGR